jgi:hypothetical protein
MELRSEPVQRSSASPAEFLGVSDMRGNRHYVHLAIMIALSFISMYVLMYALVDRFANVYSNLNQFYMAGLMTAPMVVIELALMGSMYKNKTGNIAIVAISVVALGAFFLGIRQQAAIDDKSFLRSMIRIMRELFSCVKGRPSKMRKSRNFAVRSFLANRGRSIK